MGNPKTFLLFSTIIIILFSKYLYDQNQENIREEVQVINIEVPVRVYHKGEPVLNLTREDFKLFEGKQR